MFCVTGVVSHSFFAIGIGVGKEKEHSHAARYLTAFLAPIVVAGLTQLTWPFFEQSPVALYLAILAVVGSFISVLSELMHRARRRAESSLESTKRSEEQFRTMANSIPQLAWIAHADGFAFWYNQRWHEYTGTTPEQMEG